MKSILLVISLVLVSTSLTAKPVTLVERESGELVVEVNFIEAITKFRKNYTAIEYIIQKSSLAETLVVQSPMVHGVYAEIRNARAEIFDNGDTLATTSHSIRVAKFYEHLKANRTSYWERLSTDTTLKTLGDTIKFYTSCLPAQPQTHPQFLELVHHHVTDRIIGLNELAPLPDDLPQVIAQESIVFSIALSEFLSKAPLTMISSLKGAFKPYVETWLATTEGLQAQAIKEAAFAKHRETNNQFSNEWLFVHYAPEMTKQLSCTSQALWDSFNASHCTADLFNILDRPIASLKEINLKHDGKTLTEADCIEDYLLKRLRHEFELQLGFAN